MEWCGVIVLGISQHVIYAYFSINEKLLSRTMINTPSIINATPMSMAISAGCDAANPDSSNVRIPSINSIIERIRYCLSFRYIIPSNA